MRKSLLECLRAKARRKGTEGKRADAYVFGTLRRMGRLGRKKRSRKKKNR